MNPRIASIENLVATDPGGRHVFDLVIADQLRLAAQSLRLARRVAIVSGFFVPDVGTGETDGPPGAKVLGQALSRLGTDVDYITDDANAPLFRALELSPITDVADYLDRTRPTHLVSVERAGRGIDGRYRNMRGQDISDATAPLDELFLEAARRGLSTIGIGDGGNEIGMGKVFAEALTHIEHGSKIATVVATDFCIVAGVSNWGAYGLAGALSVLAGQDLLPAAHEVVRDIERLVRDAGAVDGVTRRPEPTVDGQPLSVTLGMLESIRRQTTPSPLRRSGALDVGIIGGGESGRAAGALLTRRGHRVRLSDRRSPAPDLGVEVTAVEAGGHTVRFFADCDLVVASPGVPLDLPVIAALHRRGIPVMSELELAFQLTTGADDHRAAPLLAVTGTVGKRTTVELMQRLFQSAGRPLTIGGNRGRPLSDILLDDPAADAVALAVSSFQLETVVHFRPHVAAVLNVRDAHLDRHRSLDEYVRIKSRVFMNHGPDDVLILPFDDHRLRALARKHRGRTFFVSARQAVDLGAWIEQGRGCLNVDGTVEQIGEIDAPFPENLLVGVVAARLCGVPSDAVARFVHGEPRSGGTS